jgi:hypothetical protein
VRSYDSAFWGLVVKYNRRHPVRALRIWTLPRAERRAARAERRVEEEMRRQRDNVYTPEMRAAARDAEARRWSGW